MRKIVLYSLLSLDAVAESPQAYVHEFDEEMRDNLGRTISTQDAVLLGRRTYDEWASYWPKSNNEPFASFINGVRKYVVSSSQPNTVWDNTTVVITGVEGLVRNLREQPGGDIGVHGSIRLAQSLLEADLVDELRLVVAPATAGSGRTLFGDNPARRFVLQRAVATSSGALLADYRRDDV